MEFQLWRHDKADDGESQCMARRQPFELKPEYHDMELGEDRIIAEFDDAIYTIVRTI